MPVTEAPSTAAEPAAPPSPAGPAPEDAAPRLPPEIDLPRPLQGLRFATRPLGFPLQTRRELGDVWQLQLFSREQPFAVTSHPDHVRSLFTAHPDQAPSLTGESPLRPIVGPNSVLTLIGERHMQQRKLLLPPFHGDAVARYVSLIEEITLRELESWRLDEPFALASRMQALTLDVIMGGVFGIQGRPQRGTIEHRLRTITRRFLRIASQPLWFLVELQNMRRTEPKGALKLMMARVDRELYALIDARRSEDGAGKGNDVMSLLMAATDEQGRPMSDQELRDELLTLVLAGHETTANSLAWTVERLLRTPAAYDRLRESARGGGEEASAYVEATIHEGMRVRPVIPMVGRLVRRPWQLGEWVVPAGTPVAISIVALHHREDIYPDPHTFRPERFLDRKPGTYTWIPFGGGIRRCLGATLAMAEQRVVLQALAERVDLRAPDPAPEAARQRNVTMIPRHGCRVAVTRRHSG